MKSPPSDVLKFSVACYVLKQIVSESLFLSIYPCFFVNVEKDSCVTATVEEQIFIYFLHDVQGLSNQKVCLEFDNLTYNT